MEELNYNIAIVEDSLLIGRLLELELSSNPNYKVKLFATGEALFKESTYQPDVIVLDYFLDGEDEKAANGLEIIDRLEQVPVIAMSGQEDLETALSFVRKGVCDYIVKDNEMTSKISKSVREVLRHQAAYRKIKKLKRSKRMDFIRIGLFLLSCMLLMMMGILEN